MRTSFPIYILFLAWCVVAPSAAAQSRSDAQKQSVAAGGKSTTEIKLEQLRNEIAAEELALAEAENNERKSADRLNDLNRQLSLREQLMRNYSLQIAQLRVERDSLQESIAGLNQDLSKIKDQYRSKARHAYKYGRQHDAALILSASSINQMLVRINYLRRFTLKRKEQLGGMRNTAEDLTLQRTEMQRKLVESEMVLVNVDREQEKLDALRKEVGNELRRIKDEKESRSESLAEKRTMESQLTELIRSAVSSNTRKALPNSPASLSPTVLTTSFSASKGKLGWPSLGNVLEPFGDIVHPKYGTKTPNPGILIGTEPSAEVLSVFAGQVTTIDFIPDMGRFIIVEHGDYHTVYGNFSLIYVSKGDNIEVGQLVGRSGTEAEPRGEAVFFAVFKNGTPEDPASWLKRVAR